MEHLCQALFLEPDDQLTPNLMTAPVLRYDFIRQPDGSWTWQRTNPDGSTTRLSARHGTIAEATADAAACGFQPSMDHWIIDGLHTVTYVESGKPPKSMKKLYSGRDALSAVVSVPVGLPGL